MAAGGERGFDEEMRGEERRGGKEERTKAEGTVMAHNRDTQIPFHFITNERVIARHLLKYAQGLKHSPDDKHTIYKTPSLC